MKVVKWANENANKIIVIVTKTVAQADYVYNQIRINSICVSHTRSTIKLQNGSIIKIMAEYTASERLRGLSIDLLLFCNVNQGTRIIVEKHLIPQTIRPYGIVGELKI